MGLGDAVLVGVGFTLDVGFGEGVVLLLGLGVGDEVEGAGELLPPLDPSPGPPPEPPSPDVPSPGPPLPSGRSA